METRDPSGIIFALIMVVVAAAIFFAVTRLRKRNQPPANVSAQREEQVRLRKLVEAGNHVALPDGSVAPKCYGCDRAATQRPYEWSRGDGIWDLVRRKFGAPARVRIEQSAFSEPVSCEDHLPLLFELFRLDFGQQEIERARLDSEHETRRARFQREGVYEQAKREITDHAAQAGGGKRGRRQKSEATVGKVLPFGSSARTGTESK